MRFEAHDEQGMHDACSVKMLCAVSLDAFKCVQECSFKQLRPTFQLFDDFDACAVKCEATLKRQSQRDLTKMSFDRGIKKEKSLIEI